MTRKAKPDASKAVAYIRVSTDEQALGPEAQRGAIERWAAANGVTVVAWFDDLGVSGGAPLEERPGLSAAVAAIETMGAGVLAIAKRDRLARDVMTAAIVGRLVERNGARILTADGTGNGTGPEAALMQTMVDAFAEYERALIRARTRAALAVKRSRGERVGSIPIGSTLGEAGKLAKHEGEAAAVARVHELRRAGVSIRRIADALEAEGYQARGARWHARTVQRLLERSTIATAAA